MDDTQLLQFQGRKLRLLEDETQALQASDQGRNGNHAVVEQLVSDCLRLPEDMQHAWKRIRQVITSGATVDYQGTGDMLKETFGRVVGLLTNVHLLSASISKATGSEVERQDELIDALATVRNMETGILSPWPWPDKPYPELEFDEATLAAAKQESERGEGEDLGDIIARVEMGGPICKEE